MALADLHIHTVASDGRWTPEQVVVEVQARDIGLFAIADHDSVASVSLAETLAREAWEARRNSPGGIPVNRPPNRYP